MSAASFLPRLRTTVAATSLVARVVACAWAGIAVGLFGLDIGEMHIAFIGADDDGADAADLFAPAGFHVADDDRTAGPELDDRLRRHVVHELGAGDLALHVFDDRDRRLGGGRRRQRQQARTNRKSSFHLKPHQACYLVPFPRNGMSRMNSRSFIALDVMSIT